MKKKILVAALAAGMVTAFAFGLAACAGDPEKEAGKAPENARVEGTAFLWDAVDGATEYTVKINEWEAPAQTATLFDLASNTAKEHLSVGDNNLFVKTNETETKTESAYTAAVVYTYTPSSSGKTAFAAPVLSLDGDVLSWTAIDGATNGYTVSVGDKSKSLTATTVNLKENAGELGIAENVEVTVSVKVNATDEKDESAAASKTYTLVPNENQLLAPTNVTVEAGVLSWSAVDGATEGYLVKNGTHEITVTETSVDLTAKKTELDLSDGQTVTTLTVSAKATAEKTQSNPASVSSFRMPGYTAEELAEVVQITAAVEALELPADWTVVSESDAEDYLTAIAEVQETIEALDAIVKEHEQVVAASQTLTAATTAAQNVIKTAVDALAQEVATLNAKVTASGYDEATIEEDADALIDLEEQVEDLGAYATTLWTEERAESLAAIRSALSQIAVDGLEANSTVLLNNEHSERSAIYVMRQYLNIFDEAIEFDEAPEMKTSENVTMAVTFNRATGWYVWELTFAKIVADSTESVTISYQAFGDDGETEIVLAIPKGVIYNVTITEQGKLGCAGAAAGEKMYLDVYYASDLEKGTNGGDNDKDLIIKNAPIVFAQEVTCNVTSEDELKSFIAREDVVTKDPAGEDFVFIVYKVTENDNGSITLTNTSWASAMEKKYVITEEDAKVRLNFSSVQLEVRQDADWAGVVQQGAGDWSVAFMQGLVDQLNGAVPERNVTIEDLNDYLRYFIDVKLNGTGEAKRFYADLNLDIGHNETTGEVNGGSTSISALTMKSGIYQLFEDLTAEHYTLNVGIALAKDKENIYGDYLRESLATKTLDWDFVTQGQLVGPINDGVDAGSGVFSLIVADRVKAEVLDGKNPGTFGLKDLIENYYGKIEGYDSLEPMEYAALVNQYLQIQVDVLEKDTDNKLFTTYAPFVWNGYSLDNLKLAWANDYFNKDENSEKETSGEIEFNLQLSIVPRRKLADGTELKFYGFLLGSTPVALKQNGNTLFKAELTSDMLAPTTTPVLGLANENTNVIFVRAGMGYATAGEVFTNSVYGTQYVEVAVSSSAVTDFNAEGVTKFYLFCEIKVDGQGNSSTVIEIYLNADKSGEHFTATGPIFDSYYGLSDLGTKIGFDTTGSVYFYTRVQVDLEKSVYTQQGEFSEAVVLNAPAQDD